MHVFILDKLDTYIYFTFTGRCDSSWAMYIDGERSWLIRGGDHFNRSKGGVRTGDVIGVFLSCTTRTLSFYLNRNLKVCLSPSIYVNAHNLLVTLFVFSNFVLLCIIKMELFLFQDKYSFLVLSNIFVTGFDDIKWWLRRFVSCCKLKQKYYIDTTFWITSSKIY